MLTSTDSFPYLREFIEKLAVGDLASNAEYLTEDEEQHLIDKLRDLHKAKATNIKGAFSLLSLEFQSRSGAWLMAMFSSSRIVKTEFTKKKFNAELEYLVNPEMSLTQLFKLLEILQIDREHFSRKYEEWVRKEYLPYQERKENKIGIFLPGEPIFDHDEYESDPDTVFHQDMADNFSDSELKTIYHNASFQFDLEQEFFHESGGEDEEDTVSLGIKRKVYRDPHSIKKQRKRRARRPIKARKIKEKIHKKLKQVSKKKDVIFSARKQRQILLRNQEYDQIIFGEDEQTPVHKKPLTKRRGGKSEAVNRRLDFSKNFSARRNDFMDEEPLSESEEQNDSDVAQVDERRIRLRRMENISHGDQEKEDQYLVLIPQLFAESISNICIRNIQFLDQGMDEQELKFEATFFFAQLEAMSMSDLKRETMQLVKKSKRKCFDGSSKIQSIEIVMRALCLASHPPFSKIKVSYFDPIIEFWLVQNLCSILAEVIEILYTPTHSDFQKLREYCQVVEEFLTYKDSSEISEGKTIESRVIDALGVIVQQLMVKTVQTDSMISFPKSTTLLKQMVKVQIQESDFIDSVIIGVNMLKIGWLEKVIKYDVKLFEKLEKSMKICLREKVKNKSQFLAICMKTNSVFQIPTTMEVKERIQNLAKEIDLSKNQSEQFFINFHLLYQNYIKHAIEENPRVNGKHMLNYLTIKSILSQCKKFSQMKENHNYAKMFLSTFSAMLQFPIFHNQITLKQMMNELNKINLSENLDESTMRDYLKILIQGYEIKYGMHEANRNFLSQGLAEGIQKQGEMEKKIENYFETICFKFYNFFLKERNQLGQQKKEKFYRLIKQFFTQFFMNEKLEKYIQHYFFSLGLIFRVFFQFIFKKENRTEISTEFIDDILSKIQKYGQVKELMKPKELQESEMDVEDDRRFDLLLQYNKNCGMLGKYLSKFLDQNLQSEEFNCLTLHSMNSPEEKKYYEFYGAIVCLSLIPTTTNIKKNLEPIRLEHMKQIRIVKYPSGLCFQTNEFVIEFLKGLTSLMISFKGISIDFPQEVKSSILDIVFVCLYSKNTKTTIKKLADLKVFRQCDHFFAKALLQYSNEKQYQQNERSEIFESLLKLPKSSLQRSVNEKFREYLKLWTKINNNYIEKEWKTKRTELAILFVEAFTFLLRFNAKIQLINEYRSYVRISDPYNQENNYNFLKCLDVRQSGMPIVNCILGLFKVIYEKGLTNLKETEKYYLESVVKKDMKELSQFHNICSILDGLIVHEKSSFQFCEYLFENIVYQFLNHLSDQLMKEKIVKYFFRLFRNYEKYSKVLLLILRKKEREIEGIIKNSKQFQNDDNMETLISKYVIASPQCHYCTLAGLMEERVRRSLKFGIMSDHKVVESQSSMLERIIRTLQNGENSETLSQFRKLKKWITEAFQKSRKSTVERLFCSQEEL